MMGSSSNNTMKDLEDVASVLLREGLHVTALELNSELHRTKGRELKTIRDYFSNPPSTHAAVAAASAKTTTTKSSSSLHAATGSHSNSIGRKSHSPSLNESEYITCYYCYKTACVTSHRHRTNSPCVSFNCIREQHELQQQSCHPPVTTQKESLHSDV